MSECQIFMEHVDMSYPSNVYNARSIKQDFFSWIKKEKQSVLLKDVHALNDFTFRAEEGDRVGVIGHNGAGKSTLLKTIAGIYPIEKGTLQVMGKIRSLFDISLGFDLESTGRENILYRGLLLGASPEEIASKEEEIIQFTDIGEFIDYPVKAYSTGMAVRLAFAVSTCLPGEILLLDEVVAAGDTTFQKKAKRRILDLMDEAKIMVFVTHDLKMMREVCNRTLVMNNGQLLFDGDPDEALKVYMENGNRSSTQ